jgi:hypothetical protein
MELSALAWRRSPMWSGRGVAARPGEADSGLTNLVASWRLDDLRRRRRRTPCRRRT